MIQKQGNCVPCELKPRDVDFTACQRSAKCCKTVEKTYLKTLQWEVLPQPYSLDIDFSDYHLFRTTTHGLYEQCFTSYENTKKMCRFVDDAKKMEKRVCSNGQCFE